DLAALARHQAGEVVGLLLDDLGEVVEQLGAVDPAGAAPAGVGGAGGGDGLLGVGGSAPGKEAEDLVGAGGVTALEVRAGGSLPAPGDEVAPRDGGGGGGGRHDGSSLRELPAFPGRPGDNCARSSYKESLVSHNAKRRRARRLAERGGRGENENS